MTRYPGLILALAWSIALAAAVVLVPLQPLLGAVAVAAVLPVLALALLLRPAIIALALAVALLAVGRAELPPGDPQAQVRAVALAGATVVVTGTVTDDSRPAGGGSEVLVEPLQIQSAASPIGSIGNLMVRWRGPGDAAFGDQVLASGKLTLPRDLPAFDRRAYLAQHHVYLELQTSSFEVTGGAGGLAGLPGWLRGRYIAALDDALPAPHSGVLLGIVLGIHRGLPARLQNALIATGLIHLLVLSGLKVAVFARIVQGALNPLLRRHSTWPAVALIALYAMIGGATPAAIRASAMGGLAIAASHLGRPSHVWTSLAITAALMLGWHPELAWDVGFQLSFAGTAAIILLTPSIARRVAFLPEVVREPFAVTCAAQIGTLPMMATDFHVLSPVAPIANALTLPVLPVLVASGLLLGALSFVPDVARVAALPITGLVAYIEQVAYLLARVPGAAINIPTFPTWLGAAYYSALGPAVLASHARAHRRRLALAATAIAPACIAMLALAMWVNSPAQVVVMNVGDGQAVLVRGPQGTILVDGGPSPTKLSSELGSVLPPWQRNVDALIITAPGLGHTGGFAGLDRAAATVLVPGASLTGSAWRTAALEQAARGAAIHSVRAGQAVSIAGFVLQILAPEQGAPGEVTGAADLAFRAIASDGRAFCDFSDLDLDAQSLVALRLRGGCDNLLLPSGGRSLLSPDLALAAIKSDTQLIASRGSGRLATGFPPSVLRTDQEGTITLPM
ncbi:MAG TPA: ComEC/Rec2 family competence protein [Candidatus Dormibacteraeota bacterium]